MGLALLSPDSPVRVVVCQNFVLGVLLLLVQYMRTRLCRACSGEWCICVYVPRRLSALSSDLETADVVL